MTVGAEALPQRAAIFGATSGIAAAVARRLAAAGDSVVLVGRDAEALAASARDLRVRGAAGVAEITADLAALETLGDVAERAWGAFSGLDMALIAYGSLPSQAALEADPAGVAPMLALNFVSPAILALHLARRFEQQRSGILAAITSVAGDRGRKSNYLYGAAKGGLQQLLEGLRHRLYAAGVQVLDIRPGFVMTRMTEHLPQGGPLWAEPDRVAADIVRALRRRRAVLYTPWFWRVILAVVRALPRALFHRTAF
jgi:decaprenylphospho-beta-D-erythro-pentofuranosid-2-ulose 2-reductase